MLLHDIGKVEAYDVGWEGSPNVGGLLSITWSWDPSCSSVASRSRRRCAVICADQRLELHHIILSHHGTLEFGSPVQPMTIEAEIVHRADDASAKSADMLDARTTPKHSAPVSSSPTKRIWRVGRRSLWQPPHSWEWRARAAERQPPAPRYNQTRMNWDDSARPPWRSPDGLLSSRQGYERRLFCSWIGLPPFGELSEKMWRRECANPAPPLITLPRHCSSSRATEPAAP